MTKNVYTVGWVNRYIKGMLAEDPMLGRIYVKGEVSNCKYAASQHIYFSLKDESGSLSCVMFAGKRSGLRFHMNNGDAVIVLGQVDVFERDGKYQLYAQEILPAGEGDINERFERLKKKLMETGLFAEEYKRPIPFYSSRIGIVTSPTGAVLHDIQTVALRRNPYVQLILYPAQVQGEGAAESIVRGIETLDRHGVDVIIVGRGGGSMEDLWAFNEEAVAYAIFNCRTPVISAVGHETDFTIADFVADLRAATPSVAAERAVTEVEPLLAHLGRAQAQLAGRMEAKADAVKRQIRYLQEKLALLSPQNRVLTQRKNMAEKEEKLKKAMEGVLLEKKHRMKIYIERLRGLSPLEKLQQGYAYVSDAKGRTVTETAQVSPGDPLLVYVTDGRIRVTVTDVSREGKW